MSRTVTVKGPIFDRALVKQVVQSEFAAGGMVAAKLVKTAANRAIHKDLGVYENAWTDPKSTFPVHGISTTAMRNRAPHAAVMETGVAPGKNLAPIAVFIAWSIRKGITPYKGDSDAAREGMAYAMIVKRQRLGWPHLGSYTGGQYLGPPKPVETALDRQSQGIDRAFEHAAERIARRLG